MKVFALSVVPSLLAVGAWTSPVLQSRDVTVTETDLDNFRFYAQYAAAGYCNADDAVGSAITCSNSACPLVEASNATILATFTGTLADMEGFIALDPAHSLLVLSFGGSTSIRNWLTDFVFVSTASDLCDGCYIHEGFQTAWGEVEDTIISTITSAATAYPSYSLISTGHSLGAAVATLAAAWLRESYGYTVDIYTYGMPRAGNDAFANFVTNQTGGSEYRVTHYDDPVPRLPPLLLGYRHTSPEYWLSDGNSTTVDYSVSDVEVCEGIANTSCNAGTSGLDATAHEYYLTHVTGCKGDVTFKKRREVGVRGGEGMATSRSNVTDEELETRLTWLAVLDQQYGRALAEWEAGR